MAQQQENPIYWDQHANKWNLTLIFSAVVAVLGIVMGQELLIILGLGMAGYSWLTTPRQYLLFRDSMVVRYGMPRTRVISFAEISHVELLSLPLGERLRIRMLTGSRVMLMMRDAGAFRGHLEDALAQYHGEQSGAAYVEGTVLDMPGDTDFGAATGYATEQEFGDEPEFGAADESIPGVENEAAAIDEVEPQPQTETSGSYSETHEPSEEESEVYSGRVEQASSTSGSYTETAEPDFSGEGRSAYGADVEFNTSSGEDDDSTERPPSPY